MISLVWTRILLYAKVSTCIIQRSGLFSIQNYNLGGVYHLREENYISPLSAEPKLLAPPPSLTKVINPPSPPPSAAKFLTSHAKCRSMEKHPFVARSYIQESYILSNRQVTNPPHPPDVNNEQALDTASTFSWTYPEYLALFECCL